MYTNDVVYTCVCVDIVIANVHCMCTTLERLVIKSDRHNIIEKVQLLHKQLYFCECKVWFSNLTCCKDVYTQCHVLGEKH